MLLLAAFLHDVGKLEPSIKGTKTLEGKLVSTYNGHEEHSQKIADRLLTSLKLSRQEIDDVLKLIEGAGRAEGLMRQDVTEKALRHFVYVVGENWKDAVYLAASDDASKKKETTDEGVLSNYDQLINRIDTAIQGHGTAKMKPLLNGNEIAQVLGVSPGPMIGNATKQLIDKQLENPAMTKEDATKWVLDNKQHLLAFKFEPKPKLEPKNKKKMSLKRTERLLKLAELNVISDAVCEEGYLFVPVDRPDVHLPEEGLKDRGEFHITIISPPEFRKLPKEVKEKLKDGAHIGGHPRYLGLGKVEKDDNTVYYIVVDWPEAQAFRHSLGLPSYDFHITMGFRKSDILNVSKGKETLLGD